MRTNPAGCRGVGRDERLARRATTSWKNSTTSSARTSAAAHAVRQREDAAPGRGTRGLRLGALLAVGHRSPGLAGRVMAQAPRSRRHAASRSFDLRRPCAPPARPSRAAGPARAAPPGRAAPHRARARRARAPCPAASVANCKGRRLRASRSSTGVVTTGSPGGQVLVDLVGIDALHVADRARGTGSRRRRAPACTAGTSVVGPRPEHAHALARAPEPARAASVAGRAGADQHQRAAAAGAAQGLEQSRSRGSARAARRSRCAGAAGAASVGGRRRAARAKWSHSTPLPSSDQRPVRLRGSARGGSTRRPTKNGVHLGAACAASSRGPRPGPPAN